MGMHVYVYRQAPDPIWTGDCTNGGVSSKANQLCVINCEGPWKPDAERPAVLLQSHVKGCLRIVEADENGKELLKPKHVGPMFGGNYVSCSDSRFGELCQKLLGHRFYGAVAIHDRYEIPRD